MDFKSATLYCFVLMGMQHEIESANVKGCDGDHNCPEGYFCYREALTCAPCTNCTSYMRYPSKWNKCVKHPEQCGGCLPGYEEDILTEGKVRDLCVPAASEKPKDDDDDEGYSGSSVWWITVPAVVTVFSVIGIAFHTTRRKRSRPPCRIDAENNGCEDFLNSDRPPPYSLPRHSGSSSHCSTPESSSAQSSARNSKYDCPPTSVLCHPLVSEPSAPPFRSNRSSTHSSSRNSGADCGNPECQNLLNSSIMTGEKNLFLETLEQVAPICVKETKQTAVPYVYPDYMSAEREPLPTENERTSSRNSNEVGEPGQDVGDRGAEVNNNVRTEDEEALPSASTSHAQDDSSEAVIRSDEEDSEEFQGPSRKKRKSQTIHINLSQTVLIKNENLNLNNF